MQFNQNFDHNLRLNLNRHMVKLTFQCPVCRSLNVKRKYQGGNPYLQCESCGYIWK